MQRAPISWVIDPADPRAPPQEIWDRMSPEERQQVLDALPGKSEVRTRLDSMVSDHEASIADAKRRFEDAKRRLEKETRRAEEAERKLAEAQAELARLKGERGEA
jgi:hypothetical protein